MMSVVTVIKCGYLLFIPFDFCHLGFNCGEAANIATPEWLRVAKDAAVRRASINYRPMVSHFQLLYDLALALCSRFILLPFIFIFAHYCSSSVILPVPCFQAFPIHFTFLI